MAKIKVKGKAKGKGKPPPAVAPVAAADAPVPVTVRNRLTVMVSLVICVCSLSWVFAMRRYVPASTAKVAEAAVLSTEGAILDAFRRKARSDGIELIGFETQVFPRVTLVTYVYRLPGSADRKAFWWAYDPKSGSAHRVKSVQQFVDDYLLPTVEKLHEGSATGVPGPLARWRHQDKT